MSEEAQQDQNVQGSFHLHNQNFVAFSVLSPSDYAMAGDPDLSKDLGTLLKFHGTFPTRADAEYHIVKLQKAEPNFDIHLIPCRSWARLSDSLPSEVDYIHADNSDIIKTILNGYLEKESMAKQALLDRVARSREMIQNS